jgi:hypothetical protein
LRRATDGVSLSEFLRDTGLALEDVYAGLAWSELGSRGSRRPPPGPHETARVAGTACCTSTAPADADVPTWLSSQKPPVVASLSDLEARLARMLAASIADTSIPRDLPLQAALDLVWAHPQPLRELAELLDIGSAVRHLQQPALADVPLQVHARYTRIEILAAVGEGKNTRTPQWREGCVR